MNERCGNDVLMGKIGLEKLNKNIEVTLEVLDYLPDCRRINTKKYVDIKPTDSEAEANPFYDPNDVPENRFECMREGCINSGTMYPGVAGETIFRVQYDAVEFAAGVITFYVKNAENPIKVKLSETKDFTDADVYNVVANESAADADGFVPVVLDLAAVAPSEVIGEGWNASRHGAYISITDGEDIGISSIGIFDSLKDFITSNIVKVGCLTEIGTDFEFEMAEKTCFANGYDTSSRDPIERNITANKVSPNYWILNPLNKRGSATTAGVLTTVTQTVQAEGQYGTVVLPDLYQEECGFLSAELAKGCSVADRQLSRLSVPVLVDLENHPDKFVAINNDDGTTTLYFNKKFVGQDVNVSYPQQVDVEEEVGSFDNLGRTRVRYTETFHTTTGSGQDETIVFVYNNVYITGFPFTINEDETEFAFTAVFDEDNEGHLYHKYTVKN